MNSRPTHIGDPTLDYDEQWKRIGQLMLDRGMAIPDNYLVVDIETTGLRPTKDTILQIGLLQCIGGEIKRNFGVFVQTAEDTLQQYEHSDYVRRKIAEGNEGFIKAADVRSKGVPRSKLIPMFKQLVDATLKNIPDSVVIGHNLVGFDIPFIEYFTKSIGLPIMFPRNRVLDTGALFKANKMGMLPADGELFYDFQIRAKNARAKGVKWSLAFACQEMGLEEKHNLGLEGAHDATADVLFTHHIYQELRERMLQRVA